MVKIKTEKKMNLAELIQWAWDTKRKNEYYTSNLGKKVGFNLSGGVNADRMISDEDNFTVVVEEEITKYSEIPNLVELYDLETGKGPETLMHQNALVNNFIENEAVIALYAMNDDYTLTLLWTKDGGMVE